MDVVSARVGTITKRQRNIPRMDLSALQCLTMAVEEYARYLNPNVLEKSESKLPLSSDVKETEKPEPATAKNTIKRHKQVKEKQEIKTNLYIHQDKLY
jgi:hypothetical protein